MKDAGLPDPLVPGAVYRVLMDVVFLGTEIKACSLVGEITQTLAELRPELPNADVARAMSEFYAGRYDESLVRLNEALEKHPESQFCRSMLGACLLQLNRSGWMGLLEAVIEDGSEESAVRYASFALRYANTGVSVAQDSSDTNLPSAPTGAMWV